MATVEAIPGAQEHLSADVESVMGRFHLGEQNAQAVVDLLGGEPKAGGVGYRESKVGSAGLGALPEDPDSTLIELQREPSYSHSAVEGFMATAIQEGKTDYSRAPEGIDAARALTLAVSALSEKAPITPFASERLTSSDAMPGVESVALGRGMFVDREGNVKVIETAVGYRGGSADSMVDTAHDMIGFSAQLRDATPQESAVFPQMQYDARLASVKN